MQKVFGILFVKVNAHKQEPESEPVDSEESTKGITQTLKNIEGTQKPLQNTCFFTFLYCFFVKSNFWFCKKGFKFEKRKAVTDVPSLIQKIIDDTQNDIAVAEVPTIYM